MADDQPAVPSIQILLIAILAGAIFGLVAWVDIMISRGDGRVAAVWVPNAIALAFLMVQKRAPFVPIVVAIWLCNSGANLLVGDTAIRAFGLAGCNAIEISTAYLLARRWCAHECDMRDSKQLFFFVIAAGIIAPLVSASAAHVILQFTGGAGFRDFYIWALTDSLGMVTLAPALLIFFDGFKNRSKPRPTQTAKWVLLTLLGTSLTLLVFTQSSYPFLFLVAPVVILHAFYLGSLGTAFSTLKVAVISTTCTLLGYGPLTLIPPEGPARVLVLQLFLATIFVMGLPVAAALHRQRVMVRELAEKEADYSALVGNLTDAVLRFDLSGCCTYASPAALQVQGVEPAELIGTIASERVHPDSRERVAEASRRLAAGEIDRDRFVYRRHLDREDGSPSYIEAYCGLVRDQETGEPRETIVSTRDITDRIELEQNLVRARRHAENAALARSQFLANMSHEIRTPMNAVLGFTELLLASDLRDDQRQQVELISESGYTMMSLLSDILDISKIEAGRIEIENQACDIKHVVSSCIRFHKDNALARGLNLDLQISEDIPPMVMLDALRVRQIMHNLLGNAIKFTAVGEVVVSLKRRSQKLIITVSDSGIGIAEDRIDAIFEPFEQAENHTSRKYGGSGLGLAISRNLAELMSGTLEVTSKLGTGTVFVLKLPLEIASGDWEKPGGAVSSDVSPAVALPRGRILLAEDHPVNRKLVQTMLERLGQEVELAEDGILAIEAIRQSSSNGQPFQLVLMDVQMPNCDGYEASKQLRAMGFTAEQLPIVALTANAYQEDADAAIAAGMQDHVAKPVSMETLSEVLLRWLPSENADD